MSESMQALVVIEPSRLEIREVPVPVPGPNEVLARVRAVSICGTDAHLIRGDYPGFWPPAFPFIPGHEWAGEIAALGPGAERFGWKVGDRVAGTSHDACGVCRECVEGRYNLCENYGREGLHRQYGHNVQGADADVRRARREVRLPRCPDALTFEDGALIDPASIALHVANRGNVTPGRHGGDHRRRRDRAPGRRRRPDPGRGPGHRRGPRLAAGEGGRARLRDGQHRGRRPGRRRPGDDRRARAPTWPSSAPACPEAVEWALEMLRRGGRCAAVGIPTVGVEIAMQRLVLDELELVGSRASAGEMRRVMPHVEQGRMRVREMVTHRFAAGRLRARRWRPSTTARAARSRSSSRPERRGAARGGPAGGGRGQTRMSAAPSV